MPNHIKLIVHNSLPIILVLFLVPSFVNALSYPFFAWDHVWLRFLRSLLEMTFIIRILILFLSILWVVFILIEGGGFTVIIGRRYGFGETLPLIIYGVVLVLFFLSLYLDAKFGDFMSLPPLDVFHE
jgi:hypothetical protein